ncbi:Sugar kinase of the NBD/HSP70 family, may contain an N-terminal HTH domain [Nonomuraea solani]|uniref:Sugar kinase of the NBD/HSP70 family, may contain an N-terminal HTH domain n=1 Tax=Nonomuraea solani TaxID=1144553 RepID=A0A1H6E3M5_9ACTN|nr:ROK family protein [Nonomuraea solani]SEG91941.1 Sugar kinase of the NBD/HSP70 family, may contain an N-terminal HTH domain [Nonomuraea solani]
MMTPPVRPSQPRQPQEPVRQENLRTLNLELVFRHILSAGRPISRTELAALTGLTRPTITRIAEELLAGQLITEGAVTHSGRAGRPRVGLTLSEKGPAGLGLDIRADGLAACVVDLTGTVRHLAFAPSAGRDAPDVLSNLAAMAGAAIDAVAADDLAVVTATLAVPGPVSAGVVRSASALGWRNVDAGALLRTATRHLDLPIAVENEANLAALGELYASDNSLDSFVYVSGGLGIGAGIVLGGQLMRGARGWSGELGHVTVYPDGKPCPCGSRGCLQTYASLAAILGDAPTGTLPAIPGADATTGTASETGATTGTAAFGAGGVTGVAATPEAVITGRAEAGGAETLAALDTAGTALGIALSGMLNILDIDTVLLGGSFSLLASWLTMNARAELDQRVLTAAWAPVTIRPALLGPDAAVIGAALTSIDQIRQHPTGWLTRQTAVSL